jgi:hypothetical protein
MFIIEKIPENEAKSETFKININGQLSEGYTARVSAIKENQFWPGYQRPLDQTEISTFISISTDEALNFELNPNFVFNEVVIRPLGKKISVDVFDNTVTFCIKDIGHYTVEFDGIHNTLHIFVNPINDFSDVKNNATYYFGKGIHNVGKIKVKSNDVVYIEDGAVVYGCIYGENVDNVRICGYGILDDSMEERVNGECYTDDTNGCIKFYNSSNLVLDGLILRDSAVWNVNYFGCNNVIINNIKIIGSWRYNTDGIDICSSQNVQIKNSFIRSFDDSIVIKGIPGYGLVNCCDIIAENCVVWCDWGGSLEIGAETTAEEMYNITFKDCDIIHGGFRCLSVNNCCRAKVHNVYFQDINIDYNRYEEIPLLISICIRNGYYGFYMDDPDKIGENFDIFFENIMVNLDSGIGIPPSEILGFNSEHESHDIVIKNLYFNNEKVDSIDKISLKTNEFVKNITLI